MMGQRDYAEWDLAEFSQVLNIWNERHETEDDDVEPPSIEYMMHRDAMLAQKGYKVN